MARVYWQRILAREWLTLLGSIMVTILFVLVVGLFRGTLNSLISDLPSVLADIIFLSLALYSGILLVRSILWAVQTLRRPSG
jgi:hypothetical protein